jgi:multidrug efflux pump subunit AcrB
VAIENIDRNLAMGKSVRDAILDGSQEIAVPALVSTLCICIVFVPMFFLAGVARYLFVPLAEAVVFAMLASYALSRTLVPTMAMYLLKAEHAPGADHSWQRGLFHRYQAVFERGFERLRGGYRNALGVVLDHRMTSALVFLVFCAGSAALVPSLGRDFFPAVDAGQIRLHLRGRTGLRIEETARLADQVDSAIRDTVPAADLVTILDNIGVPNSGLNLSYGNSGVIGTSDAEILVQLSEGRRTTTDEYVRRLRDMLPVRFPGVQFSFQPADIVTQILNFGAPAPIDVAITGSDQRGNFAAGQRLANAIKHIPGAVDVHVHQAFDLPTLRMNVDRARAQSVGLSARDVAQNVLVSLSSSFQTAPSFWLDPKTGVSYSLAVQSPQYRTDSLDAIKGTQIGSGVAGAAPQSLGNLVTMDVSTRAAEASHYNAQPMINVYASVAGRDLGGVADDVAAQKDLPRGSQVILRGQVETMTSSFRGLAIGLVGAIVLAYLLIVVNFQSWLDPFIIIAALPAALAGIVWTLLLTHTTLNVPSLTGAIMCMGVATANSILVVSFARERMADGLEARAAALEAGFVRIRPVLMTALAMVIGMVPMALGFGEGGEQNAPLGRAVSGGLLVATVATLFLVPCLFTLVHGRRK